MFAVWLDKLSISLHELDDFVRIAARLQERAGHRFRLPIRSNRPNVLIGLDDGGKLPVFYFQNQQPAIRMQDDEIGVRMLGANRYVIPNQIIVFQLIFQPLRKAPLAAGHAGYATAEGGDERSHGQYVSLSCGLCLKIIARIDSDWCWQTFLNSK